MIILYAARVAARTDNYLSFLVDWAQKKHDCIQDPLRELSPSNDLINKWTESLAELRETMDKFIALFDDYLAKLDNEIVRNPRDEALVKSVTSMSVNLHSHILLMRRNYRKTDMTPDIAKTLIGRHSHLNTYMFNLFSSVHVMLFD